MQSKWKYFTNVYPILDKNRKAKLQELFLRSLDTDLDSWYKVVRVDEVEKDDPSNTKGYKYCKTDTDFYSKQYGNSSFQFDYDLGIGMVKTTTSPTSSHYELVFDPDDYRSDKYPADIKERFIKLSETVFTDHLNKMDIAIPKSKKEVAADTRNERSDKLKELFPDED